MEEKLLKDYTIKEFFTFLGKKRLEVISLIDKFKKKQVLFEKCCYLENGVFYSDNKEIKEMLEEDKKYSNRGNKDFIEILKETFGTDFFSFSEDEMKKLSEEGLFTRDQLGEIFGEVEGRHYGYDINIPSSWEEFALLIKNLISIVKTSSNVIVKNTDETFHVALTRVQRLIAERYQDIYQLVYAENILLNNVDDVLDKYKNKKVIDTNTINPSFEEMFNNGFMDEKKDSDGNVRLRNVGFGTLTIEKINDYNKEILDKSKQKEIKDKVNRIYKDIIKTPFDDLTNEQITFYSDPDVKEIYNKLLNKLDKKTDDKSVMLSAVVGVTYAGYFSSKFYEDSEKEKLSLKK